MSHIDDTEHDFDGLENASPEIVELVTQVRERARSIIDNLEPRHINSWSSLIEILEDALENAKRDRAISALLEDAHK